MSAVEELRKKVYGGSAGSALPSAAFKTTAVDRLRDIVYHGASYEVKTPAAVTPAATVPTVRSTTPTQIYEEATEKAVITPSRLANMITGAAKSTASGYASALGTTQAVTGGVARKNYLTADIEQWQKELETYRYKAKTADDAEEQKYFLLEAGKTANKIEAAKQNLLETETAGQSMQQTAKKLSVSAQQDIQEAKEGLGTVGSFLVDTGVAGAQMLGDIAAGALTGGSALPAMFVRSAGSSAQEARDAGGTLGQQVAYGLGSGALSVATEKLLNVSAPFKKAFGTGFLDRYITKAVERLNGNALGKVAISAISEGGEELAEAILQPVIQRATYDKDASIDWSRAIYDAAIGAALGGIGGGVETATSRKQTPAKPQGPAMPGAGTKTEQTAGTWKGAAANAVQGSSGASSVPMKVGRVTTIQAPYAGTKPVQARKNAAAVTVDSGSVETAKNRIEGARGVEARLPNQGFKSALKNAYKSVFKAAKGVAVEDVTFEGRPYLVDINNNVPGKVISDTNLTAEKLALLDVLPEIVRKGEYVGSGEYVQHGTRNKPVMRYDYFETPVEINGKAYIAKFDVEAYPAVNNYRTHQIVDVDLTPSEGRLAGQAPVPSSDVSSPPSNTTITRDSDFVNQGDDDIPIDSPEGRQQFPYTNRGLDDSREGAGTARENAIGADGRRSIGSAAGGFSPFTAAQMEYGTMDGGENAVRPDDVPVSTNGTDRVSRSVVTAKGAAVTPDEFVPLIENETMKGGFSFIPVSTSETVAKAQQRIMDIGWPNALRDWTAAVHRGKGGEVMTAEGALLYNHAVNSGAYQEAMEILRDYVALVRSSARGLQAAQILKTLAPENRLYLINRDIQKLVDSLGLNQPITLPPQLVTAYMAAKTDADLDNAVGDIQQYVADQLPSTGIDMWTALRYTNMLGNFKTPIRNTIGNVGMRLLSALENDVAVLGQVIARGKYGKTRSLTVSRDMMKAAKADSANVEGKLFNEAKYTLGNQDSSTFLQGVKDRQTVYKRDISLFGKEVTLPGATAPLLKGMESYRKATKGVMNNEVFGDKAFMRSAYARFLGGYLEANGYTAQQLSDARWREINAGVLDQARAFAIQQAQEVTFRDSNWLSDMSSSMLRGSKTPAWLRAVGEGVQPFRATPANILYRAEEYSPLGFVNALVNAGRVMAGSEKVTGADVIENLSKALTGSGVLVVGMLLARAGLLRGADDEDEDQAAFDDLTGHQAYSLELPDGTSVTLDWLTPLAMPLFMGAQLEKLRQEDGNIEFKDLVEAVLGNSGPMIQMSMMQGINDVLADIRYAEDAGLERIVATAIMSYFTQGLTNSLVGQAERAFEEDSTMNYVDKESALPGWLQKEIGAASRKTPGVDAFQTPYIDAWGREEEKGDAAERIFNNFFNPAYVSQWDVDEVERELQRLYDVTGAGSVFPDRAEKSVKVAGENIALSAEAYDKYARRLGQERYRMVKAATNSQAYRKMKDEDKAEVVSKCYSAARAKSIKEQFPKYELPNNIKNYVAADGKGIDLATYYASRQK